MEKRDSKNSTLILTDPTPKSKNQYKLTLVRAYAVSPTSRIEHAVCLLGDFVYLYGGRTSSQFFNDFWKFNFKRNFWTPIKLSSKKKRPPPLRGHTIVNYDEKLYMFGGNIVVGHYDETPLWRFDPAESENHWERVKCKNGPIGRYDHTAVIYKDSMFVYGGFLDIKGATKELWSFKFANNSWQLHDAATTGKCPNPRYKHTGVVFRDEMFISGGLTHTSDKHDFWSWNFLDQVWIKICTTGISTRLYNHKACIAGNTAYIYGGNQKNGKSNIKMWKTSLDQSYWTHSQRWKSCKFQCSRKAFSELSETCCILKVASSATPHFKTKSTGQKQPETEKPLPKPPKQYSYSAEHSTKITKAPEISMSLTLEELKNNEEKLKQKSVSTGNTRIDDCVKQFCGELCSTNDKSRLISDENNPVLRPAFQKHQKRSIVSSCMSEKSNSFESKHRTNDHYDSHSTIKAEKNEFFNPEISTTDLNKSFENCQKIINLKNTLKRDKPFENENYDFADDTSDKTELLATYSDCQTVETSTKSVSEWDENKTDELLIFDSDLKSLVLSNDMKEAAKKTFHNLSNQQKSNFLEKAKSFLPSFRNTHLYQRLFQERESMNVSNKNDFEISSIKNSPEKNFFKEKNDDLLPAKLKNNFLQNSSILTDIDHKIQNGCFENELLGVKYEVSLLIIGSKLSFIKPTLFQEFPKPCTKVWKCDFS